MGRGGRREKGEGRREKGEGRRGKGREEGSGRKGGGLLRKEARERREGGRGKEGGEEEGERKEEGGESGRKKEGRGRKVGGEREEGGRMGGDVFPLLTVSNSFLFPSWLMLLISDLSLLSQSRSLNVLSCVPITYISCGIMASDWSNVRPSPWLINHDWSCEGGMASP